MMYTWRVNIISPKLILINVRDRFPTTTYNVVWDVLRRAIEYVHYIKTQYNLLFNSLMNTFYIIIRLSACIVVRYRFMRMDIITFSFAKLGHKRYNEHV